jgi:hypothetical protein
VKFGVAVLPSDVLMTLTHTHTHTRTHTHTTSHSPTNPPTNPHLPPHTYPFTPPPSRTNTHTYTPTAQLHLLNTQTAKKNNKSSAFSPWLDHWGRQFGLHDAATAAEGRRGVGCCCAGLRRPT